MQNLKKLLTDKKKLDLIVNQIVSFVLVCLVLTPFLIGTGMFIIDIWLDKAFNIDTKTQKEIQVQNGHEVRIINYSYSVENYVFNRSVEIYPRIYVRDSTHVIDQFDSPINMAKLEDELKHYRITGFEIDSFERKTLYGEEELYPPSKIINPHNFPPVEPIGLAKTTLLINWRYNHTLGDEYFIISLQYMSHLKGPHIVLYDFYIMHILRTSPIPGLPYIFFVVTGAVVSFFVFQKGKLKNDYGVLSKFPKAYQEAGTPEMKEMGKSIRNIIGFPRGVGRFWRLVFGMSIFVVKGLVNDRCKNLSESVKSVKEIAPFRRDSLSKLFSKGKKSTFEKIEDTLPELKTIGIVATFLAAVGVSFSFNVAATAPFLYSLALCYFFINLGSIGQFVIKSKRDLAGITVIIIITIGIVYLQDIINAARLASLRA